MNTFSFDFSIGKHGFQGLLVDRPAHMSFGELADELYNSRRSDLTVVTLLVIRHPVDEFLPFDRLQGEISPVLERVPHLPIHILGSIDFAHRLTDNLNVYAASILQNDDYQSLMDRIRQVELEQCATKSNAILRASGSRLFRAPSKKFCRTFLRVGNVQKDRDALDSFFFWLLPWLKDCRSIVCESWTISSIALNAARLLARYSSNTHARVEVEMLSQYHQRGSKIPNTETTLRRVVSSESGQVLILVSSSMSGSLIKGLEETITEIGLPLSRFRFGALYLLGQPNAIPHLCDLSHGLHGATFECFDNPPPDAGQNPAIIEIDPQTYFPLRIECSSVHVRGPTAAPAANFINEYRNTGLLSVHRDSFLSNGQRHRHHGIYADIKAIIDHPRFVAQLRDRIVEITVGPKAIICPPHAAGEGLADRVSILLAEKFGHIVPIFRHLDLQLKANDPLDGPLLELLCGSTDADSVVIVDDVSVTGGRLSRFQTSLRQLGFIGRIHYLIGIARPDKKSDWDSRMMRLRYRRPTNSPQHTVGYAEFVVFPDWHEQDCPWCQEQEFIRLLSRARRASPACVTRAQRLQAAVRQTAMMNDVFFIPDGASPMQLTANSILASEPASQADVFCAVASTLQAMRTTELAGQTLVWHFPEIHVLDPACSFGTHFNDSVIRAAILRAAKPRELEFPDAEGELIRRQMAAAIVRDASPDIHNLAFEIGVAMALHKLPSVLSEAGVEVVLRDRGWEATFAGFEAIATGRLIT